MNANGRVVCADRLKEYNVGATLAVTENARSTSRNLENPSPAGRRMMWRRPGSPPPLVLYAVVQDSFTLIDAANAAPRIWIRTC
jgi:hypothetical protein